MLSKELETLIDAAIADGRITLREREVLKKRAQDEGVDIDEFELILESRLHSKNVSDNSKTKKDPGESVARRLQLRIDKILKDYESRVKEINMDLPTYVYSKEDKKYHDVEEEKDNALYEAMWDRDDSIERVIENLVIPNTKDDILELLNYLKPFATKGCPYGFGVEEAYKKKFQQCLEIATENFPNEEKIKKILIEQARKEKLKEEEIRKEEEKIRKEEEELSRQTLTRLNKDIEEARKARYKGRWSAAQKKESKAVAAIIEGFQLPEDKNDLLPLIKYFKPFYNKKVWKDRNKNYKREAQAFMDKYIEACEFAKNLFPDDPDIQKEIIQKKKGFLAWLGLG